MCVLLEVLENVHTVRVLQRYMMQNNIIVYNFCLHYNHHRYEEIW